MAFWGNTTQYISSAKWSAASAWAATHAYSVGNLVRQLATPTATNERIFACILAGTSLGSEPTWTFNRGDIITESGGPKWVEVTGQPAVNGDATNSAKWINGKNQGISQGHVITDAAGTHVFVCSTSGSSGNGAEPTWNTSAVGNTTTDNTVTWTYIGLVSSFTAWGAAHARLQNAYAGNWGTSGTGTEPSQYFVGHDNAESNSSGYNFTTRGAINNTSKIMCVNTAGSMPPVSADLRTSATIGLTGSQNLGLTGYWSWVYGIGFSCGNSANVALILNNENAIDKFYESCTFTLPSGTGSGAQIQVPSNNVGRTRLKNCTLKFTNTGHSLAVAGWVKFQNCSIDNTGSVPTQFMVPTASGAEIVFEGCDLSFLSGSQFLHDNGNVSNRFTFIDCKLPSSWSAQIAGGNCPAQEIIISRCSSGANPWQFYMLNRVAQLQASNVVYRANGAADNSVNYSWNLTTNANASNGIGTAFECPPIAEYNSITGSNRTVTINGIVDAAAVPTNLDLWMDVSYLGASGTPQATIASTRVADMLATPSSLTTDTSAWDGGVTARVNSHTYSAGDILKVASNPGRIFFCQTGGAAASSEPGGYASAVDGGSVTDGAATFRAGCRFKMALTLSSPQPQQAGALYARVFATKPSTNYFIDPLAVLT